MEDRRNVLVVEDEERIAEAVCSYLESKGYGTFYAPSAAQAMDLFRREQVHLVLLDLMLPDRPGEEVCRWIREQSAVPVIMLTAKVGEEDQIRGLELGADDYIAKPFGLRVLHARVEAVLRRGEQRGERLVFGELAIAPDRRAVTLGGRDVGLTPREYRLLLALARRRDKVFTREELVNLILGEDYDGFDRTVDSHIKNLRRKLEEDPRNPCYILTVHGVGYRFGGGK